MPVPTPNRKTSIAKLRGVSPSNGRTMNRQQCTPHPCSPPSLPIEPVGFL